MNWKFSWNEGRNTSSHSATFSIAAPDKEAVDKAAVEYMDKHGLNGPIHYKCLGHE